MPCVSSVSIQAMHSWYLFRLFIHAIYSGYSFRLSIQAIHSGYPFRLFILAIHSGYSFRRSSQAIHSGYASEAEHFLKKCWKHFQKMRLDALIIFPIEWRHNIVILIGKQLKYCKLSLMQAIHVGYPCRLFIQGMPAKPGIFWKIFKNQDFRQYDLKNSLI